MPNGHYAASEEMFTTAGEGHAPLHALANGIDGPNGVFLQSANGASRELVHHSTNYWVRSDVQRPGHVRRHAARRHAGVARERRRERACRRQLEATFNEAMTAAGVNATSFELRDANGALVPATVTYDAATRTATLDPTEPLKEAAVYTASLAGVTDVAGNAINSTFAWSFTTAGPPPINGPGGPILVIGVASNPFSRYFAEILRAEGFNEFAARGHRHRDAGAPRRLRRRHPRRGAAHHRAGDDAVGLGDRRRQPDRVAARRQARRACSA